MCADSSIFTDLKDNKDRKWIDAILRGKIQGIEVEKFPPQKLFLYKKVNSHSLEQITNSTVHFSTPDKFNDPFDSIFAKNIFYSSIESVFFKLNKEIDLDYFNKVYTDVKKLQKEVKISCLTESNTDIKMWSYYAASHTGICIEYDFEKYISNPPVLGVYPVFYTNQIQNILELSKHVEEDSIHFVFDNPIINLMALCKFKIWEEEKEWRLFERIENFKENDVYFPISSIYIGLKTTENDRKSVCDIALTKGIPCYQMEVSHKNFGIIPGKRLV